MKKTSSSLYRNIYNFLLHHEVIILFLAFLILLRIPNLFEPYWYGDEGIYLTVGTAMRQGFHLYAQTLDHKTPIIYYLAMAPTQFWFRMLLMGWMTTATAFFFLLTKNLRFSLIQRYVSTLLFILFTSLPWLEGNIPNGELFVMGFVIIGAWIFTNTEFMSVFLDDKLVPIKSVLRYPEVLKFSIAGLFFSLAILTKVPALFDVLPFFAVGYFTLVDHFSMKRSRKVFFSILGLWEVLSMAVVTPIILSLVYFALRGTLHDYIDIGLLYNFRYASNWALPNLPLGLGVLYTMKGKLAVLATLMLVLTFLSKKLSARTQFVVTWSLFSLFGALLSSRPYPHYLLQIVPAFALLIASLVRKFKYKIESAVIFIPIVLLIVSISAIGFGFYSTSKYYVNFARYLTHQLSRQAYFQTFDPLMNDNYEAASILKLDPQPRMYIWGTDPTLYALTKKIPTGRFITAFHLPDFPGAFEETYQDLVAYQPEFIVVMKSETIKFPQFFTYLELNYLPYKELSSMIIYKKTYVMQKDLDSVITSPTAL